MKKVKIFSLSVICVIVLLFSLAIVPLKAQEQIKITSDSFSVDESATRAIFSGNVIITQPDLIVWADKVIVRYGKGGPSDLKEFEAIGNVKIEQPEQTAIGDKGIYNPKTKTLQLFGNVSVSNDSGTITGDELLVDIATGTSSFPPSDDGGRVTAIFDAL